MEIIGIVGAAGDLGSKMTVQACSTFQDVYTHDLSPENRPALTGIDPTLEASDVLNQPKPVESLEEILDRCTIVHWAAPIEAAKTITSVPRPLMLVLHDSVMANSLETARHLNNNSVNLGEIVVAHCLTNEERMVVIAKEVGDTQRLVDHIGDLGLKPKLMDSKEHDLAMAHSQAVFAILCKVYRTSLEEYATEGLLTPSGRRLLTAIEDNESRWSPATFRSIVTNPMICDVLTKMLEAVTPE